MKKVLVSVLFSLFFTCTFASQQDDNKELVRTLLHELLESPSPDLAMIERYMNPDYRQYVNGEVLDYEGFVQHMTDQKSRASAGRVIIERIVAEGDDVVTVHTFEAVKGEGDVVKFKVLAYFHIINGKISVVDEVTHMLEGGSGDENL